MAMSLQKAKTIRANNKPMRISFQNRKILIFISVLFGMGWIVISRGCAGSFIHPLPFAGHYDGMVLDRSNGKTISGAEIEAAWWCHDYPDPHFGNYWVRASANTDAKGRYRIEKPKRRAGWFSTDFSLSITAKGYIKRVFILDPKGIPLPQETREYPFIETTTYVSLPSLLNIRLNPSEPLLLKALQSDNRAYRIQAAEALGKMNAHYNQLAIGKFAHVSGSLEIDINPAIEFDFKKKSEILELRSDAVYKHKTLLKGKYIPSCAVFGGIADSRPWWGLKGYHFHWKGKSSIKGASEESRYVMNPFLLVAAHLNGKSLYALAYKRWKQSLSSDDIPVKNEIPSYSQATKLKWWPNERRIEVTYNLTAFFQEMYRENMDSVDYSDMVFDLIAYNARDMNLNYLYIALTNSTNVKQKGHSSKPVKIKHMLHRGGSCDYPGGCNNMSPDHPAVQEIKIQKLPALLEVFLWKKQPASLEVTPEITVKLRFI